MDIQFIDNEDVGKKNEEKQSERLRLGDILKKYELITDEEIAKVLQKQKETGLRFGEVVLQLGMLTEDQVNWALAYHLNIPYVELNLDMVDVDLVRSFPGDMLRSDDIIPIMQFENEISVAMADPTNIQAVKNIESIAEREVKVSVALRKTIHLILDEINEMKSEPKDIGIITHGEYLPGTPRPTKRAKLEIEDSTGLALINFHLIQAMKRNACEIHIEPGQNELRVRYRIHGTLHDAQCESKTKHYALINRLRVKCNFSTSGNKPSFGTTTFNIGEENINVAVSLIPGVWGEAVVIRIIQPLVVPELKQLSFEPKELEFITQQLIFNSGLVIIAGNECRPRSRMVYSLLNCLKSDKKRIITLERNIQNRLDFATQIDLADSAGLDIEEVLQIVGSQRTDIVAIDGLNSTQGHLLDWVIDLVLSGSFVILSLNFNQVSEIFEFVFNNLKNKYSFIFKLRFILSMISMPQMIKDSKELYQPSPYMLEKLNLQDKKDIQFYKPISATGNHGVSYDREIELFELFAMTAEVQNLLVKDFKAGFDQSIIDRYKSTSIRDKAIKKIISGEFFIEDVLARIF